MVDVLYFVRAIFYYIQSCIISLSRTSPMESGTPKFYLYDLWQTSTTIYNVLAMLSSGYSVRRQPREILFWVRNRVLEPIYH